MDTKTAKLLSRIEAEQAAIRRVDLSSTVGITKVPDALRSCKQLEFLDLTGLSITSVPEWVFQFPNLKRLRIFCTELPAVPDAIGLATELEELHMDVKPSAPIPPSLFTLAKLQTLMLAGRIIDVPEDIAKLKNLTDLELIDTRVQRLPVAVGAIPLKRFAISQSIYPMFDKTPPVDLAQIIEVLASNPKLRSFEVTGSSLGPIPASINQLKGLTKLKLTESRIADYPPSIYDLVELTELLLGVNEIGKIHPGIGRLAKLKKLELNANWKNKLDATALFDEISSLAALEQLNVSNCLSVTTLPAAIASCKKLKSIDIDNNIVASLPPELATMTWLQKLRISTNKLTPEVGADLSAKLPNTKVFCLIRK